MEQKLMEIEKEIGEIKSSDKSAHKRIDSLEKIVNVVYDLASNVKVMVNEMSNMKTDISDIKDNMEEYHHKEPNKLIFNIKNAIATGIAVALVGGLMALIMK